MRRALRAGVARVAAVAARRGADGDAGSAVVEFLGLALILLVPTVYLVLVLARLQSAAFAVDGAARDAARVFVSASDAGTAGARAVTAVGIALADQGLDPALSPEALALTCGEPACLVPGGAVTATVALDVPLPGVPRFVQGAVPLSVPVTASATATVDEHADVG